MKIPIYERNRRIQAIVKEASDKHYAVWFRSRRREFMISGKTYKEKKGLEELQRLLNLKVLK